MSTDDADEAIYSFAVEGMKTSEGVSLDFDGVDDKVDLPFIFSGNYTKEAWIKTRTLDGTPNIVSGTGTALYLKDGKITAGGHGGTFDQAQDPGSLTVDTWYHVAVSYNATTQEMKIFRNGALVATALNVPNYIETEQKIGSYTGIFNFWGTIDQVRLWNVERTAAEILNSYNCKISGDEPGLLAWYNFSNGFGGVNNAGLTILQDDSDKCLANNGTLTGFALDGNTSNWLADSVLTASNCAATFANIRLTGNAVCINSGDVTPSLADYTDFGSTAGTTKTFVITNTGTASLTIGAISFSGTDNSMFTVPSAPSGALAPGASVNLTVQFTPASVGDKFATMQILSDDADEAIFTVDLKATGVTAPTGPVVFTAGAITVCQDAPDETYTATAENSTSITYSVLPVEAGTINSGTGVMNWDAAFFGTATITAVATGLDGTTTADRIVTVNPSTGATTFTAGATTVCQDAADETYTATAANSTS
ncbi:MAG: choice-of-anchor D domain-containing protein, partial [Sphingobacteriales bacterium]